MYYTYDLTQPCVFFLRLLLLFSLSLSALHSDSARLKTNFATPHSFSIFDLPYATHGLGLGWSSTVMAVVRSFTVTLYRLQSHAQTPFSNAHTSTLSPSQNETSLFSCRFANGSQRSDTKIQTTYDRSCQRWREIVQRSTTRPIAAKCKLSPALLHCCLLLLMPPPSVLLRCLLPAAINAAARCCRSYAARCHIAIPLPPMQLFC